MTVGEQQHDSWSANLLAFFCQDLACMPFCMLTVISFIVCCIQLNHMWMQKGLCPQALVTFRTNSAEAPTNMHCTIFWQQVRPTDRISSTLVEWLAVMEHCSVVCTNFAEMLGHLYQENCTTDIVD